MNTNRWIKDNWPLLALAAVAGYLVYRTVKGVGTALTSTGAAIGTNLYDVLHPNDGSGESIYYMVTFEDGTRHAIPGSTVQNGHFMYNGASYSMINDAKGFHYALAD